MKKIAIILNVLFIATLIIRSTIVSIELFFDSLVAILFISTVPVASLGYLIGKPKWLKDYPRIIVSLNVFWVITSFVWLIYPPVGEGKELLVNITFIVLFSAPFVINTIVVYKRNYYLRS